MRTPDALTDLQQRYGQALEVETLDVLDRTAIGRAVEQALQRGPIDVVVNNAGYGTIGAAEELTDAQIYDQLQTLLCGPIAITRAFLPSLRLQGGGHIVQLSSVGGQTVFSGANAYHAAKWGLEGFTESVAQEVIGFGIRFTLIEPGAIRTGFGRALQFAAPLAPYNAGAVAELRRHAKGGNEVYTGDPAKIASVIVDVTRMPEPPLRLALGRDAYEAMDAALQRRLGELAQYRELSCSVSHSD